MNPRSARKIYGLHIISERYIERVKIASAASKQLSLKLTFVASLLETIRQLAAIGQKRTLTA